MHCRAAFDGTCRDCACSPLGIWATGDAAQAAELQRIRLTLNVAEGALLFDQAQPSQGLYCISSGVVGLRMVHRNGTSVLVALAFPGDLVGTRAFLRDAPHHTSAHALTALTVCKLPRERVRQLTRDHPHLYQLLVNHCLRALDASQDAMLQSAALPNRERLHQLLVLLLQRFGSRQRDGWVRARLPLSREDLAGMLGVRQETLSRLLRRLQDDHLIEVSGRTIGRRPSGEADTTRERRPQAVEFDNRHGAAPMPDFN